MQRRSGLGGERPEISDDTGAFASKRIKPERENPVGFLQIILIA